MKKQKRLMELAGIVREDWTSKLSKYKGHAMDGHDLADELNKKFVADEVFDWKEEEEAADWAEKYLRKGCKVYELAQGSQDAYYLVALK